MLYFSNAPIALMQVDQDQYSALLEFKKSCQIRGLYWPFNNLAHFEKEFSRHLIAKVRDSLATNLTLKIPNRSVSKSSLTPEAVKLLKEISIDKDGLLHMARIHAGFVIQTNGENFVTDMSSRTRAKWEAVVEELSEPGYITPVGSKGETLQITSTGYAMVDTFSETDN